MPSRTEYPRRIAETGLRRFVLNVTPELMSILTECCESSASRTFVALLKDSSSLTLSLNRLEDGASARIEASLVGDPFGGIAGGGIMAGYAGLNWIGVELEPRFVALGQANIQLHAPTWCACGDASFVQLVQGDSRQFARIVGEAAAVLTSPPYAEGLGHLPSPNSERIGREKNIATPRYGQTPGQIGALTPGTVDAAITSPPYNLPFSQEHPGRAGGERGTSPSEHGAFVQYGTASGQIEGLPNGDVGAVITSPPFTTDQPCASQSRLNGNIAGSAKREAGMVSAGNIAALKSGDVDAVVSSPPFRDARSDTTKSKPTVHGGPCADRHETTQAGAGYGATAGQIGNLKEGTLSGVATSPPYEAQEMCGTRRGLDAYDAGEKRQRNYGGTQGQIGREQAETYWQAMHAVYAQCLLALKPGGYMAVVVKNYVKNKEVVPLCDQTLQLLTALGFEPVERIRAMLVKHTKTQGLFCETTKTVARKSFFRRLAESKGSPKIDWEEVLIVRKPNDYREVREMPEEC